MSDNKYLILEHERGFYLAKKSGPVAQVPRTLRVGGQWMIGVCVGHPAVGVNTQFFPTRTEAQFILRSVK